MTISSSHEELNLSAMQETLKAAALLLPIHDLDSNHKPLFDGQSRMGYPAAILLFCFIESIGHLVSRRKIDPSNAFHVLRSELFQNQNISEKQCQKLHYNYRCKLCHNLMLPENFIIDCDPYHTEVFPDINGNDVMGVNLYALLKICEQAIANIEANGIKPFFDNSAAIKSISKIRTHSGRNTRTLFTQNPSSYTQTNYYS